LRFDFIGAFAAPVIGARDAAEDEALGRALRDRCWGITRRW